MQRYRDGSATTHGEGANESHVTVCAKAGVAAQRHPVEFSDRYIHRVAPHAPQRDPDQTIGFKHFSRRLSSHMCLKIGKVHQLPVKQQTAFAGDTCGVVGERKCPRQS